jgi:hypothetical protein
VLDLLKCSWICFQNEDRQAETACHTPGSGNPTMWRDCAEMVWAADGSDSNPRPGDNCEFAQMVEDALDAMQKGECAGDSLGKESMATAAPTVGG